MSGVKVLRIYMWSFIISSVLSKAPPGLLVNVTVVPSMVVATVRWHVADDGGYPILYFTLLYMPISHPVNGTREFPLSIKVSPIVRKFLVYHLKPGTQYMFQIWASNKLGPGRPTSIKVTTARPLDMPDVVEKVFAQDYNITSTLWMVATPLLFLSCFTCVLIYRNRKHVFVEDDLKAVPDTIANPGFDLDLEEAYLVREADQNGNTEQIVRTNNNSIVRPECM